LQNQQNRQAILLFTRTGEQEARSKSWSRSAGQKSNQKIAELLIGRTRCSAAKTEADLVVYDSERQQGQSFGERFTNAFQDLFDSGYSDVVAVGNDTPELNSWHLNRALEQLEQNKAVLGPSRDGGVYLIGLTKSMFNPKTFQDLPWETSKVNNTLEHWLTEQEIAIESLEPLQDIDNEKDLRRFLSMQATELGLRRIIRRIVSYISSCTSHNERAFPTTYTSIFRSTDSSRAPPVITG